MFLQCLVLYTLIKRISTLIKALSKLIDVNNINTYNKHISTLIKDIDTLTNVGRSWCIIYKYISTIFRFHDEHGTRVAQLTARLFGERGVAGSIPG